jgi:hypothetical protein
MHKILNNIAETSGNAVEFLDAIVDFCKRRMTNSFRSLRVLVDRGFPTFCYARGAAPGVDQDSLLPGISVPWHDIAGRCIKEKKRIITADAADIGAVCVMAEPLRYFNEFFGCAEFVLAEEPGRRELEILETVCMFIAPAIYFLHSRAGGLRGEGFLLEEHDLSDTAALAVRKIALMAALNGKSVNVTKELEAGLVAVYDERAICDGVLLNVVKDIWAEWERRGLEAGTINVGAYDDDGRAVVEIRDDSGGVAPRFSGDTEEGVWMDAARETIAHHGWALERQDAEGAGTTYYVRSSAVETGGAHDLPKVDSGNVTLTFAGFRHDGAIVEAGMWGVRGVFEIDPKFPPVSEEVLVEIDFGGGRGVSEIPAIVFRVEEASQYDGGRTVGATVKFSTDKWALGKRLLLKKTLTEQAVPSGGAVSGHVMAKRKYYRLKVEGGSVSVAFGGTVNTGAVIEAGMGGILGVFDITPRFPRVADKVRVDINFKGGQRIFGIEAEVVRIEAEAGAGGRRVRAAIKFSVTEDAVWKEPLWNALTRQIVVSKESSNSVVI